MTQQEQKLLKEIQKNPTYRPICFHALGQPLVNAMTNIIRELCKQILELKEITKNK